MAAARAALTASGYQLFKDTTGDGQTRWTGNDPRSAPIEILGEDEDPAKLTVTMKREEAPSQPLLDVLELLGPGDRAIVLRHVGSVATRALSLDQATETDTLALGYLDATWVGPTSDFAGAIYVEMKPDARAYPTSS